MKVLIVGSGGREHAIATSVAKSEKVSKIYCAPGNAGIGQIAECVSIGAMEFDRIVAFAKEKEIDLTIVGMDDPLVGGLVDELEKAGLRAFGPRKNAAILEGSKAFSKDLMKKYNIPTASYENFETPEEALVREIREELDTEIAVGDLAETVEYDYPTFHLSMRCYWCSVVSGELELKEHAAAKWLSKEELFDVEWLPADIELIKKIQEIM